MLVLDWLYVWHITNRQDHCLSWITLSCLLVYSIGKLDYTLLDKTLVLDWSSVFTWKNQAGELEYIVSVGSSPGSANLVTGHTTRDTSFTLTSSLLVPPIECFVQIIAVAPPGGYVEYTDLIVM